MIHIKYLLGIKVFVEKHKQDINITVDKKYPELSKLEGDDFYLNKEGQICCNCKKGNYRIKIQKLEHLLYEIEVKTSEVKKAVKNVVKNSSNRAKSNKKGNTSSDSIGNDEINIED